MNILNTLKLIEYCVLNCENLNLEVIKFYKKQYLSNNENDFRYKSIKIKLIGLPHSLINKILVDKPSNLINKLINNKVVFFNQNNVKGFWKNNNFNFSNGKTQFNCDSFFCLVKLKKGLMIFKNSSNFIYMGDHIKALIPHKIDKNSCSVPYYYSTYHYNKKLNNTIKIQSVFGCKNFIFSEEQNKIIEMTKY